jgi:flagellar biosynthesis GTPase FlhF
MPPRRRFCPRGHDTFEVGRDSSYRCRRCKLDAKTATRKRAAEARRSEAEAIATERAAVAAAEEAAAQEEAKRRREETERQDEAEYQRILDAGGDAAAEAKWQRLYDETLDSTGSRYGLCQWALDNGEYGACTRRTASVYCWRHNRQLDRESEQRRRSLK